MSCEASIRFADASAVKMTSRMLCMVVVLAGFGCALHGASEAGAPRAGRSTTAAISGPHFLINGAKTYAGRTFRGMKLEGLLFNARLVQGIFDDQNPETRELWKYPDGPWDAERNTREFIAAMPAWRRAGLLSFTVNLQGGSPYGYGNPRPWWNSAVEPDGSLRADYLARLERILDRADELGMIPIVGLFYGAQEKRLEGEAAVLRAVDAFTDWLLAHRYTHVLVEIANECNGSAFHEIIRTPRAHELIERIQHRSAGKLATPAGRLLVSTSFTGKVIPPPNVARVADFLLLHGNKVEDPAAIRVIVQQTRQTEGYRGQPILFNEDDHFGFDEPENNFLAAVAEGAGWGLFDFRRAGEGHGEGFQSVPADWSPHSSARKRGFFRLLAAMTGGSFE